MTNYQENTQENTQENSQENSQESFSLATSQNRYFLPPTDPTLQDILNDNLFIPPYNQNSSFNSNIGTASSTGANGLSSFDYSLEDTIRRVITEVISKDLKNIIQDTIKEALTNVGNSNLVSLSRKFHFLL